MKRSKEFNEMLLVELVSVTGGLAGGVLLAHMLSQVELLPGLFILLPGLLELRGNIGGALAGRLSEALHAGEIRPHFQGNPLVLPNVLAVLFLTIAASAALGIVAFLASEFFLGVSAPKLVLIAVISATLSTLITMPININTTFWLFRHGHDPDNIMGPYITTVGDIVSIASLYAAITAVTFL